MKNGLIGVFILLGFSLFAQKTTEWCGTDKLTKERIQADPSYKGLLHRSLSSATQFSHSGSSRATITIPIVVHIIHDNGIGNISDAQIYNAIDILNEDYQRMNVDTSDTRATTDAPFKEVAAGMDVEFKFAKIDPNGNCTNGIVRVNAPSLSNNADESCKYSANGGSDQWRPDRYFNIWVVNSIDNGGAPGITLGYAFFPYGGAGLGYGILIRHDAFGVVGTASSSDGRTLTHEMGHALGLPHIFDIGFSGVDGCHTGDCATNGDYSCDTPPQTEPNWSCSQTLNSCNAIPVGDPFGIDVLDQIENYMSYNSCQNMFSQDQVNIMENNINSIEFLDTLRSAYTLMVTGVNTAEQLCRAEFDTDQKLICAGNIVNFQDYSFYNPTSWTWTVTPGTVGTDFLYVNGTSSSSSEPEIQFLTGGRYSVTLEVSDGLTSTSETKSEFITVYTEPTSLPFLEGFEGYTNFATTTNWIIENDANTGEFEINTTVGHTGSNSVSLNNYGESNQNTDALTSSLIDLSSVDPATETVTLSFRYAYRKKTSNTYETLKVLISNNCGDTWAQRKTLPGDLLSTIAVLSSWTPQSTSDWTTVHVTNITSAFFVENFQCKFEFDGGEGNNLFLDDINIYKGAPSDQLVGIEPLESTLGEIALYPNPANDALNIRFEMANAQQTEIEVTDITGKQIFSRILLANEGSNIILLDTETFSNGTYFVKVNAGNGRQVKRVVIQ